MFLEHSQTITPIPYLYVKSSLFGNDIDKTWISQRKGLVKVISDSIQTPREFWKYNLSQSNCEVVKLYISLIRTSAFSHMFRFLQNNWLIEL